MSVSASLHPTEVPISHEGLAGATLQLHNSGDQPVELRIDITGEAAGWSWVTPATLTLPAGGTAEVKATFKAPRSTLPPAGPLPVGLHVGVPGGSQPPVIVEATLDVAAFTDLFATMEPPVSEGSRHGRHTLTLANRGNATVVASLGGAGVDDGSPGGGDVGVDVEPSQVSIASGANATVTVTARPPGTFLRGEPRDHPFRVEALVDGEPATAVGAVLRQRALAPGWLPRAAVGVVGVVAVATLARLTLLAPDDDPASVVDESAVAVDDECPANGHLGGIAHGQAQAQALTASGYAFLYADDSGCQPIRFPACEPVHYVVNDTLAPPGAVDDVHAAIGRLSEASGLDFVYDGTTDEPLDATRAAYQPERYGQRWAPILIGWSALGAGSGPDASGDDIIVAGRGNPIRVANSLVSGVLELNADVILDRDTQERLPGGFGEGITRGRVLLHELGHVMGLGHVASRAQLMYPELAEQTSSTAELGVGDRVGLRLVGREAGCVEPPPLPR